MTTCHWKCQVEVAAVHGVQLPVYNRTMGCTTWPGSDCVREKQERLLSVSSSDAGG